MTATCTRVLAILLSHSSSSKWFHSLMTKPDYDVMGKSLHFPDEQIDKNGKSTLSSKTFKTALLTQIRSAIDDPRLRISALQLFRKTLLLREREANLQVAEHAALVYQCVDEIGILLLYHGNHQKVTGLCCNIYVDFLMLYPMTDKVQQKRIAFLIRNLSYNSFEGRRAMLSVIYELAVS